AAPAPGARVTPHRASAPSTPQAVASPPDLAPSPPAAQVVRPDTIALVEQLERPKMVTSWMAIAIIAVLSLLAGLAAYFLRSVQNPADSAASGATAQVPAPSFAPASRGPARGDR